MSRPRRLGHLLLIVAGVGAFACNDYDIVKQPVREAFYQTPRTRVDLLFVVDDSPSMLEEADSITIAAHALLEATVGWEVDLRVRAVTTSHTPLADWQVVDTLEQVPDLAATLAPGSDGDRHEPGLAVALDATDGLREDALLHVVILSDEDDRSDGPVTTYTHALAELSPAGVAIHPITGDLPAGCARDGLAADPAPRYHEAATHTDGTPHSICSASLDTDLRTLSFALTGLTRRFALSSIPDTGTLAVWVAGASVPQSAHHGWTWSPSDNALVFDGFAIPPAGARIEVEYALAHPEAGDGIRHLPEDTALP